MSPSSVTVRYWAAAKAAAGVAEEAVPHVDDLATLLDAVRRRHGDALATVLGRCSYLVDEVSPGRTPHEQVALAPGAVVDVLPPFAGGGGVRPGGTPREQAVRAPWLEGA